MTNPVGEPASSSPFRSNSPSTLILVVEDDAAQREALTSLLAARGHSVEAVASGAAALDAVSLLSPDLVLLDLGLPDIDGLDLCRHLLLHVQCPIIAVTADAVEDRVVAALEMGASDYVVKPYRPNELMARVSVGLRHQLATAPLRADEMLVAGDVEVDVSGHRVRIGLVEVDMLPRQFDLLCALARNQGRLMTYDMLIRMMWGDDLPVNPHLALRTAISKVRASLGVGANRPAVETEQRVGYRLVVPVAHS